MAKTKSVSKARSARRQRKDAAKRAKVRKRLTKRRKMTETLRTGTHLSWIFVGQADQRTLMTIHTALIPASTQAFLVSSANLGLYIIEDDAEIVEVWRQYLYTGKLFVKQELEEEEWCWLADAYLLGVAIKDERFCNTVISAFIDKQYETDSYPTTLAAAVYEHSEPGNLLRELIVDFHVWAGQGVVVEGCEDEEDGPVEFLRAVKWRARRLQKRLSDPAYDYPWVKACKYHEHQTTEHCSDL